MSNPPQLTKAEWCMNVSVKLIMIGCNNGLSSGGSPVIIWTNAGIFVVGTLGLNCTEIWIIKHNFYLRKYIWQIMAILSPSKFVIAICHHEYLHESHRYVMLYIVKAGDFGIWNAIYDRSLRVLDLHQFKWSQEIGIINETRDYVIKWKQFPRYWPSVQGIAGQWWIPITKASDVELWCIFLSAPELTVE